MKKHHTPGPWELTSDPCHYDTLTSIRGGPAEIRGKRTEWRQMMVEVGGYADPATAEANARLIAAAPDLLAALRKCWGWTHRAMELEVSGSMVCAQTEDAAEAFAAITKALGPDWQNAEPIRAGVDSD